MPPYGFASMFSLDLAMLETSFSQHEFIMVEHMFEGITKLQDFLDEDLPFLNAEQNQTFRNEVVTVFNVLGSLTFDPRVARRLMRILLGKGDHTFKPTDVIHREPRLKEAFSQAEHIAQEDNVPVVGIHHFLIALLMDKDSLIPRLLSNFSTTPQAMIDALRTVDVEVLFVTDDNIQESPSTTHPNSEISKQAGSNATGSSSEGALDTYGVDLVALAREGKIDDVYERDNEIFQIMLTLTRTTKNNALLIGEPGVGKTAIVEGLAYRIATGNVPDHFLQKRVIQINLAQIVGGSAYRGMFEERLVQLIEEARTNENVILFIDEIHMLFGAGGVNGSAMDAANILKPALSRMGFALIGATTIAEYNRFFDRDAALERRFSTIMIDEPTAETTLQILKGKLDSLHANYGQAIIIYDEAVEAAVTLADRYLPDRQFPDKAFEILDEACAVANFGGDNLNEFNTGSNAGPMPVTVQHIQAVVNRYRKPDEDAIFDRLRGLEPYLKSHIIGQNEAISEIVKVLYVSYTGFKRKDSPIGVFLFVGPTGVGKTQLVKSTAEALFNNSNQFIRIDMSEFMEKHNVARLIGSPPGYVGYEEGGQLTDALRMNPNTIVLIDEVEKAHPDVLNIFLQTFSDGRLTDSRGRTVNATQVLFIMTSNLGYEFALSSSLPPSPEEVEKSIELHFRPEFINRIDKIVHFGSLRPEHMLEIVDVHFLQLRKRIFQERQISLEITDHAREWLAEHGYDMQKGARSLERLIRETIVQPLGGMYIEGTIGQGSQLTIDLDTTDKSLLILPMNNETQD